MKKYESMTKKQLAELIVDRNIKAGHYKEKIREYAVRQHLLSDKETLVWNAQGGRMRRI